MATYQRKFSPEVYNGLDRTGDEVMDNLLVETVDDYYAHYITNGDRATFKSLSGKEKCDTICQSWAVDPLQHNFEWLKSARFKGLVFARSLGRAALLGGQRDEDDKHIPLIDDQKYWFVVVDHTDHFLADFANRHDGSYTFSTSPGQAEEMKQGIHLGAEGRVNNHRLQRMDTYNDGQLVHVYYLSRHADLFE